MERASWSVRHTLADRPNNHSEAFTVISDRQRAGFNQAIRHAEQIAICAARSA
jgi:hypothetical protein